MDQRLLEILACSICKGKLIFSSQKNELICRFDKMAYPVRDNIPIMLADQARHLTSDEV